MSAAVSKLGKPLLFDYLNKAHPALAGVKKALGHSWSSEHIASSLRGNSRQGEVLLRGDDVEAFLSYRTALRKTDALSSFFVEKVSVFTKGSSQTSNCQEILARIKRLARRKNADHVTVEIKVGQIFANYLTKHLKDKHLRYNTEKKAEGLVRITFSLNSSRSNSESDRKKDEHNRSKRSVNSLQGAEAGSPYIRVADRKRGRDCDGSRLEDQKRMAGKVHAAVTARGTIGPKEHRLPMKGTIYFHYIMDGSKPFEGRVNGPGCQRMQVGDHLRMFDRSAGWGIVCEIVSKSSFKTFRQMLEAKGVLAMLPQLSRQKDYLSPEALVNAGEAIYRSFPGSQRVAQHGAVAIGVKFIKKC